ncbi:MAG: hypothetical protein A2Y62_16615 [Candidatus Fischerbacteria bacterium RBG_13_37_8]|uniref:non-specific protein-tyrosine kinase n=1 Tax=Candidatus Fischerbacteria bacterium RBG_13_37_8 TaxID=1817863 RepID=A0A1F5VPS3_9BACT|nr:MAG: hypothetical protein A2Y62_16615 [Candidatus Fischerbacteria bacterium RBG_13_37_8]
MYGNELEYEGREPELKDYLYVILKRKEVVAVTLIIIFLVSLIYSLLQVPVYRSSAVIEIKPEKIQIVDDLSGQTYYQTSLETLLNTQVRILKSRDLAKRVIYNTNISAEKKELLPSQQNNKKKNLPTNKEQNKNEPINLESFLLGSLEVNLIRGTRLIEVSFITADAKFSSKLANSWVENFINMSANLETLTSRNTSQFIAQQIGKIQNEIADKEARLRGLAQNSEIVIMDEKLNIAMKNLSQLNTSLFDAQSERINKESYYNKIKNSPPDSLPEVFNNPVIQNLENDYNKLERDSNEKSIIFKPQWPEMVRIKDQLQKAKEKLIQEKDKIYQNILDSAKAEYLSAIQKENKISAEFQQQKSEAMKLNADAVTYNALKVELENQKLLLDSLLKKRGESSISAEIQPQTAQNIRIIERANIPQSIFKPNIKINIFLSIIIGLMTGFAMAFFIDYIDDKVKSIEDIEHYIKLPLLGLIPLYTPGSHHRTKRKKKWAINFWAKTGLKTPLEAATRDGIPYLISHSNPKALVSEAFKVVRTSIMLTKDSNHPKCILITSTQPKEGKTFVATNLAITLSQVDKKVILLDCDLRNPMIHKIFKQDNSSGVSSLLLQQKKLSELIIPTPITNLSIMTAGHRAPRPAELLSLPAFKQLLDELKKQYDIIILDSPPIVPIADTSIIAPSADMTILVLLNEGTPRKSATLAINRLRSINCDIFGCMLNSVDFEGRSNYYYKYYNYSYYYGTQ